MRAVKKQRSRSETGAVMMEAAVTLPCFLFIVLVAIDLARIAYVAASLQYCTFRAVRWSSVYDTDGTVTREDQLKAQIQTQATSFGLAVDPNLITICSTPYPTCGTSTAGGPGQFFWVRVQKNLEAITPGIWGLVGNASASTPPIVTALAIGKNEYYTGNLP